MEKQVFLGTFNYALDSKNRVAVPKVYSKQLDDRKLILSRVEVASYPIIAVFPSLITFNSKINRYFDYDDVTEDEMNYWNSISQLGEIDSAGRIALKKMHDIIHTKMVTVAGRQSWFEFWDAEDFNNYNKSLRK